MILKHALNCGFSENLEVDLKHTERQILTSIHKTNVLLKGKTEAQAEVRHFFQIYL